MARVIAFTNLKGGVGRSNVCVNLSMFLSALGKRVLLVDLSPQGDATFCLGITSSPNFIGDVLLQKINPRVAIKSTSYFGYDIMPSFPKLNEIASKLAIARRPEMRLSEALDKVEEDYDFIIIDTPADFNILTLNALFAAKEIIVPIQCEFLAWQAAHRLVSLLQARNKLRDKKISALLTMYGWRSRLSRAIAKKTRNEFPGYVFNAVIPRAAILAQSQETKEPILKSVPNSRAARAYRQLAEELISRESVKG